MDGLRISQILAGLRNPELYLMKLRQGMQEGENVLLNNTQNQINNAQNNILNNLVNNQQNVQNTFSQNLQQNNNQNPVQNNGLNQQQTNTQNTTQNSQPQMHNLWGPKNNTQANQQLNNQNNQIVQQNNVINNAQQSTVNQPINNVINNQNPIQNNNIIQNNNQIVQNNILQNTAQNIQREVSPNDVSRNITSYTANKQSETQMINREIPVFEENNIIKRDQQGSKSDVYTNSGNNTSSKTVSTQSQASQISAMDRSVYIKNLLGLPQTLGEILLTAQNKNNPITVNTLMLNNLNQEMLANQKMLSQIFDEKTDIPINPALTLEGELLQQTAQMVQATQKDAVMLLFSGMVHMPAISELILKNSKQAAAQLILAMASASKNGMTAEEIRNTLNIINSCVSMADSGNPVQTLKSLMLLYLPWLPLNEGVGFDLEVDPPDGENESIDSKLTVLIQTRNFGNVKGVFTLTTSNSVDVYIICSDDFPKRLLQKSLQEESTSHAMNTTIDIDSVTPIKKELNKNNEAKVNLSATNEMNPYLLLMAHAFIRNTIYIDSNGIIEDYPNAS